MKKILVWFTVLSFWAPSAFAVTVEDWSALQPDSNIGVFQDSNGSKAEFTTGTGPKTGEKSLRLTLSLADGGFCGVWHNLSADLSKNSSLKFMVKCNVPCDVQLSLGDAYHMQYVAKFKALSKDWNEVNVSFSDLVVNPYYTPPDAVPGHPMDLSKVSGLNFQPLTVGSAILEIGPVEGEGKPWAAPVTAAKVPLVKAPKIPVKPEMEIKLDQVGYLPAQAKNAFITSAKAKGPFRVLRLSDQKVVLKGILGAPVTDVDSGDILREADFSSLAETGSFCLEVRGVGRSFPFQISEDAYRDAYYLSMRAFYGQRCGTAVDLSPRFPQYHYNACHLHDGEFHASSGKKGKRDSGKGWHDAGDYGKYIVNSGISTGTLLWTYEWYKDQVGGTRLDIPESGDGTPDLLDEIKWNLDWMLTMQDGDGGVWHKLTTEKFCGFVMPEADTATRFIIGTGKAPYKNSTATADFAAVMACAARIYQPLLPEYAQRCRKAAEKAWGWVKSNPSVNFSNPAGVATGGYGDGKAGDEMLWASAELFSLTGKGEYGEYFKKNYASYTPSDLWPQAWPDVANLGLWAYALSGRKEADPKVVEDIKAKTIKAADGIVEATKKIGYRHSLRSANYIWGSNSVAANFGIMLLAARRMDPKPEYLSTALENLHYLLGRNTFGLCFVTHLGSHSMMHPHHRPSGADGVEEPWPGLLAGGPNRSPQDPALRKLPAGPPARAYTDDQESYASNEIAINWNAPLVFLLAATLPSP